MTRTSTTTRSRADIARRLGPAATAASGLALDILSALSIGVLMAAVLIWACVFAGRI